MNKILWHSDISPDDMLVINARTSGGSWVIASIYKNGPSKDQLCSTCQPDHKHCECEVGKIAPLTDDPDELIHMYIIDSYTSADDHHYAEFEVIVCGMRGWLRWDEISHFNPRIARV